MVIIQNISYTHPNKDLLFSNINFTVNNFDKTAIVGHNGVGKSTLLKIIGNELEPSKGNIQRTSNGFYIPQGFGQFNHLTVAEALKIDKKVRALKAILSGIADEANFTALNDDWTIEDRCKDAFSRWNLKEVDLTQKMETLSGGQKTKVFLAGISIHQPNLVLMDEPSNHLDDVSRHILYEYVKTTNDTLIIVSHDRTLLNLINKTIELTQNGVNIYGGNYNFYREQKRIETNALNDDIQNKEKTLRKAKVVRKESEERQQKLNRRGKRKQVNAGMPKSMMDKMKNDAERSTSRLKGVHAEKIEGISSDLFELRSSISKMDKMQFGFDDSSLHSGKILFRAKDINHSFHLQPLWKKGLNFEISSQDRIALKGENGSGKTTLIRILLEELEPGIGEMFRAESKTIYIDQDYSLLENHLNLYEQAEKFNESLLQEHEIKTRLNRFLFTKEDWDKPCNALSGGERMRLLLCCINIQSKAPDIIVLDEPTNNLDLQNIEILTSAINEYRGTLIVVSHDQTFLNEIGITREILLKND